MRKDELYVLEDDLNSCPQSQLGVVITQSALEQYPELSEICQKLSRELTGEKLTFTAVWRCMVWPVKKRRRCSF